MKKNLLKYSFIVLVLLIALIVFGFQDNPIVQQDNNGLSTEKLLVVDFLNVGQGDAIYIRTPDDVDVLIDGGPDNSILNELGAVMPFWDKEIDLMILTHPHSDHVNGLVEVLRRYKVKKILYTGVVHTAPDYLAWLKEIKDQKIPLEIVDKKSEIKLGSSVELELLYPQKSFLNRKVENLNNTSIVARLVYGQTSFLFTGDAEVEVEEELLSSDSQIVDSDMLKVAHHGSESSSSLEFLSAVTPTMSVIQVGEDNSFNHPHGKTLFNLKNLPSIIYRTDTQGRISMRSNAQQIFVEE
ncbi:MAG: putative hydrolases of metallo-beta-lactamase fold protein [Parcubacteria group bacterium GW2011_GWC2_38_7]|nr:MAG: putative hydrolases of metallo-beta-lactamase fold protein [Parcubacteria group bacterium GW2011_GWC2_38_7]